MNESAYWRNFCMRAPRPALVRVIYGEESQDIEIDAKAFESGQQSWARVGDTVAALDPDRVELYSESQTLLRADKRKVPKTDQYVRMPDGLHKDPEAARLMHFADLLHRAYQHSSEVAFNRIVDIVQMQSDNIRDLNQRADRAEKRLLDQLRENIALRAGVVQGGDGEEEGGGGLNDFLSAFLSGMSSGKQARRPAPAPTPEPEEGSEE